MMMSSKKVIVGVSIVVTTFNDSSSIVSFLENIDSQSVRPQELLIVDGGSTDETVNKIEEYNRTSNIEISLVSDGQRRNISEGLNEGIKKSTKEWVLILGTGNYYDPNYLEALWSAKLSSNSFVFYSNVLGLDQSKFAKIFNQYFLNGNQPFDWEPSNHGVLISREVFKKYGLFWENFYYAGEDSEFFNRITDEGLRCEYVNTTSVHWETPKNWKEFQKKMEVNAIGDWQIYPPMMILGKILISLSLAMVLGIIEILTGYSIFVFILLIFIVAVKKKTRNLAAIFLGLSTRYILIYYYFKNKQFAKAKWSVTQSEPLIK